MPPLRPVAPSPAAQSSADTDSADAEQRMRRNLGMSGSGPRHGPQQGAGQARARHRFVQDGEVPVVALNGGSDAAAALSSGRFADLHASLESERSARASAVRALDEARTLIASLQARLAHAELASQEAVAAERHARVEAERALAELAAHRDAASPPPAPKRAPLERVRPVREPKPDETLTADADGSDEPEPVKWWLPGFNPKKGVF